MRTRAIVLIATYCVATGCASRAGDAPESDGPSNGNAVIIRASEISGGVLQAIRTKIPSVRVATGAGCPQIAFRGNLSFNNQPNPTVYIDGTLLADTCALTTVSANELERVEVYTSGDTPYPSIRRNPAGVIIVYRRRE